MEKILVHSCCASCAIYVLGRLRERFDATAYFYNPNIHPHDEYLLRLDEMRRVCDDLGIELIVGRDEPETWWKAIEPFRDKPEKSERCWECYRMRLYDTASMASQMGTGIFTTTLSVSPHKIYSHIVEEGRLAAARFNLLFHAEDFKKRDGFKKSIELGRRLNLTRQSYCGCLLSLEEAKRRKGC